MNTWGNRIKLTVFGTSHGAAVGVALDGLRAGLKLDTALLDKELLRRAPRVDGMSTPRRESDRYELISGVYNGFTDGTPIVSLFRNTDARAADYD